MLDWKEDTTPNRVMPALEASTFFLGKFPELWFPGSEADKYVGSVSFIFTIIAHLMKDKFWNRKFKISSFQYLMKRKKSVCELLSACFMNFSA